MTFKKYNYLTACTRLGTVRDLDPVLHTTISLRLVSGIISCLHLLVHNMRLLGSRIWNKLPINMKIISNYSQLWQNKLNTYCLNILSP